MSTSHMVGRRRVILHGDAESRAKDGLPAGLESGERRWFGVNRGGHVEYGHVPMNGFEVWGEQ